MIIAEVTSSMPGNMETLLLKRYLGLGIMFAKPIQIHIKVQAAWLCRCNGTQ